jgi:hypothetical protein
VSDWQRVNNVLLDPAKVCHVRHDEKDSRIVYVNFDSGDTLKFVGDEAVEVWKLFAKDPDWRG